MNVCMCAHPIPFGRNLCARCYYIIAPSSFAATPFEGGAPGTTAGADGVRPRPALADPSPWDVDSIEAEAFVPAYSDDELDRIAALVAKHSSQ